MQHNYTVIAKPRDEMRLQFRIFFRVKFSQYFHRLLNDWYFCKTIYTKHWGGKLGASTLCSQVTKETFTFTYLTFLCFITLHIRPAHVGWVRRNNTILFWVEITNIIKLNLFYARIRWKEVYNDTIMRKSCTLPEYHP